MAISFDDAWADGVSEVCDGVFAAADVGFVRQVMQSPGAEDVSALLWEADPTRFAARYPDSGIVETYGEEQWPGVHCIDYWVYVEADSRRARISVEGWAHDDHLVPLTGDGTTDGRAIGTVVADILRVPPPP